MRVKAGQLRQWKADVSVIETAIRSWEGTFLVLERHPDFTNEPFWRVLRSAGDTKLWSESRIEGWSEVISAS